MYMNKHGAKWIRPAKRLRIYERDEWRCACCGRPVYSTALVSKMKSRPADKAEPATLDHFIPRVKGGSNHEKNLVTVCLSCNSRRQDMPMMTYLRMLRDEGSIDSAKSQSRWIKNLRARKLLELTDD